MKETGIIMSGSHPRGKETQMKNKLLYLAFVCAIIGVVILAVAPWPIEVIGFVFILAFIALLTIRRRKRPR
ncbi:hypothetical protein ES703_59562 [subsurface metagenome]